MSEENATQDPEREPTQEELDALRTTMQDHFNDQIPFLKLQKEYEELITAIDTAQLIRYRNRYEKAQIMQAFTPPKSQEESTEKQPRKLKSE